MASLCRFDHYGWDIESVADTSEPRDVLVSTNLKTLEPFDAMLAAALQLNLCLQSNSAARKV